MAKVVNGMTDSLSFCTPTHIKCHSDHCPLLRMKYLIFNFGDKQRIYLHTFWFYFSKKYRELPLGTFCLLPVDILYGGDSVIQICNLFSKTDNILYKCVFIIYTE
jgi:hypothetical protein